MSDTEFRPYEFENSARWQMEIAADHLDDTPAMTAFLRKGAEMVWINAYAEPPMVVETYPPAPCTTYPGAQLMGCVREIHVGRRVPLSEKFAESILRHEREGWTHVSPRVTTEEAK